MGEFDFPTSIYDVVCRTSGCWNEGEVIRVPADKENPLIVCGACDQRIHDISVAEDWQS